MVVVVILIVVLAVTVFGGRSDKETVNKFCDAVLDGDARGILDLVPDKVMDYAMEEHGYDQDDLDDMIDDMEDSLQVSLGALDLFGGSITYEITDMETLTGADLQDIRDDYQDINMKISAAKTAEVTLYIESAPGQHRQHHVGGPDQGGQFLVSGCHEHRQRFLRKR